MTNAEIAWELVVSAKTVDHHVSSVLAKLGVATRGERRAEAVRLGLQDREPRPKGMGRPRCARPGPSVPSVRAG
jgi:hypothetical protein